VTQRYYDYIAWNGVRYEPFTSPSVRLALSLAIDRGEVLAGLAIAPYAQPAAGPYPPILRMLVDATLEPDPFLPDSARALLAAAGWSDSDGDGVLDRDGQPFEFTLLTQAGNERRTSAAQVVQAQLAAVGIDMQVQALDFGALLDIMFATREFDAVLLGWQVGLEPDYVVGLFWPSDHTFNITGYASEAVDVAIDRAMSAASSSEAAAEWKAVARAIADDHPYAFLWYFSELVGVNNRVQDTRINTYGVYQNLHRWRVGR
jgi:peptide/nickel transport system substrate-binding protein